MSRVKLLGTTQILILSVLFFGCRKKASEEIDFGTFSNSVYTNKYFGVTVTIPPEWNIQSQESQQRLMKTGARIMAGDDKNFKAIVKASELQTVNLFTVCEHPLGAPVPFNSSLLGMAEMVRELPGIKRGKDYLFQMRKTMEGGQIQFSFPKDVYSEQLGEVEFDVLDSEMKYSGKTIKQKYYSTIKKGYALCFILSFGTADEEVALRKILDTVAFH